LLLTSKRFQPSAATVVSAPLELKTKRYAGATLPLVVVELVMVAGLVVEPTVEVPHGCSWLHGSASALPEPSVV
jgi:hypothetical protein